MVAVWLALACATNNIVNQNLLSGGEDSGFVESTDEVAPVIVFEPLVDNQPSGEPVVMTATISDEGTGLFLATLYFRNETDGSKAWQSIAFVRQGQTDEYTATISADKQLSSGMFYYLYALDGAQNESSEPPQGADQPYHFGYTD